MFLVTRSKARRLRQPHDLSSLVKLERVTAPKQLRSTQSLHRIIEALEKLLRVRSFAEITISDIEAESKCGIATIYARFRDKKSILAALHESVRDRFYTGIDERLSSEKLAALSLDEAVLIVASDLVKFYSSQHNLLRAVMLIDDTEVYVRITASIQHASKRMQTLFGNKNKLADTALARRIDIATRAMYALLQQRLVMNASLSDAGDRNDKRMIGDIALLLRSLVSTSS